MGLGVEFFFWVSFPARVEVVSRAQQVRERQEAMFLLALPVVFQVFFAVEVPVLEGQMAAVPLLSHPSLSTFESFFSA